MYAFYSAILNACTEQQQQDEIKSVHWSRHLLARIVSVTKAKGIIGCRSLTRTSRMSPPTPSDTVLGSVWDWPDDPSVLLLDTFPKEQREALLRRATGHTRHVWIVRMVGRDKHHPSTIVALSAAGHNCTPDYPKAV